MCTSSSAQAVFSACSCEPPTISQVARHSMGLMRFPPAKVEYLHSRHGHAYHSRIQILAVLAGEGGTAESKHRATGIAALGAHRMGSVMDSGWDKGTARSRASLTSTACCLV